MPTRSTGRGPLSTARACPRKKGPRDGSEPDGPGQAWHEASHRRGRQRHTARPDAHGANCHDSRMLAATLDAVPGVRTGRRGRPRRRPDKLHADKGYDHRRCRRECLPAASRPGSLGAASRAVSGSAATAGSSSERWRGWPASAVSPSDMSVAPTSISPSPRSPALSSAKLRQNGFVPDFNFWHDA